MISELPCLRTCQLDRGGELDRELPGSHSPSNESKAGSFHPALHASDPGRPGKASFALGREAWSHKFGNLDVVAYSETFMQGKVKF